MSEASKIQLIEYARKMNRSGINQGTSGNLSVRQDDWMLITPSAVPYDDLEPGDIVQVNFDGSAVGSRKPSSEWRLHLDVYRDRPDARAILHAHPVHCTALACLRRDIPAFHYMVAVAGGSDIRCSPYATFGTQELSEHAVAALEGRKACLMANHGLVCLADNLDAALALAIEIESLARSYLQCLSVGEPVILDEDEMNRVLMKFESYKPE